MGSGSTDRRRGQAWTATRLSGSTAASDTPGPGRGPDRRHGPGERIVRAEHLGTRAVPGVATKSVIAILASPELFAPLGAFGRGYVDVGTPGRPFLRTGASDRFARARCHGTSLRSPAGSRVARPCAATPSPPTCGLRSNPSRSSARWRPGPRTTAPVARRRRSSWAWPIERRRNGTGLTNPWGTGEPPPRAALRPRTGPRAPACLSLAALTQA